MHGVLCWRTRAQLVALALHVVQDLFPGLRERGVKRIDLATGDAANASLTSSTVDMPATFPGTEILNRQLRARGIVSLQLSVGLTPRQIVSSVLLLLCVSRRRSGDGAPAGDTTYLDQKIRVALTSSAGHCQFGARMHWDAASGRYRVGLSPQGGSRGGAGQAGLRGRGRWSLPFSPLGVVSAAVVLAVATAVYGRHGIVTPPCVPCLAMLAGSTLTLLIVLVSFVYGRLQHGRLHRSYWGRVRTRSLEVEAQNRELQQTNALKDTLLQVGSHDIRSPLVNIMLLSDAHLTRSRNDAQTQPAPGAWCARRLSESGASWRIS